MATQSSRHRVVDALNYKEPDRVSIDLGGWQSGSSHQACGPLNELLCIDAPARS